MSDSISVLFRKINPCVFGTITLDARMESEDILVNDVTEYPVETGATVSDHIWPKPRRFSIKGFITNAPVKFLGVGLNPVGGIANAVTNPVNYTKKAYEELERICAARELVEIFTPQKTFKNMAIEKISIPSTPADGEALYFTAEVKQVVFVNSLAVAVYLKAPKAGSAKPKAEKGKTPTTEAGAKTEGATMLLQALKGIGLLQ